MSRQPKALGSGCAPGFGDEGGALLEDGAGSQAQACPSEASAGGEGCPSHAVRNQRAGTFLGLKRPAEKRDEGCCI